MVSLGHNPGTVQECPPSLFVWVRLAQRSGTAGTWRGSSSSRRAPRDHDEDPASRSFSGGGGTVRSHGHRRGPMAYDVILRAAASGDRGSIALVLPRSFFIA